MPIERRKAHVPKVIDASATPARVEWETAVQTFLCELADCSNGDAQGLIEANADLADDCFARSMEPRRAAARILGDIE